MPATFIASVAWVTAMAIAADGSGPATIDDVAANGWRLAGVSAPARQLVALWPLQPASSNIASAYVCAWIDVDDGFGSLARSGASRADRSDDGPIHVPATSARRLSVRGSASSLHVENRRESAVCAQSCHASTTSAATVNDHCR